MKLMHYCLAFCLVFGAPGMPTRARLRTWREGVVCGEGGPGAGGGGAQ